MNRLGGSFSVSAIEGESRFMLPFSVCYGCWGFWPTGLDISA